MPEQTQTPEQTTADHKPAGKNTEHAYSNERIIFFDGVCVLCNSSVKRTIKLDKKGVFKYAALQGSAADQVLGGMTMEQRLQGMIVFDRGSIYQGHEAVVRIGGLLYPWLAWASTVVRWFPFKQMTAFIYGVIARHRYKWFGELEACALPDPKVRDRYIMD